MDSVMPANAVTAIRASAKAFEKFLIVKKLGRRLFLTKTATVQRGDIVSNMVVSG
jgi:hypothetical protein